MTFAEAVDQVIQTLNTYVIPVIFSVAALAFLWGVVQYFFLSDGDATKQTQARSFVLWGLIGLAVLFSTWGLVNILLTTFGLQSGV